MSSLFRSFLSPHHHLPQATHFAACYVVNILCSIPCEISPWLVVSLLEIFLILPASWNPFLSIPCDQWLTQNWGDVLLTFLFSSHGISSVSNGSILGTAQFYRSAWQWPYHIKNWRFFRWTAQLSSPILIREFTSQEVNYAVLHGASFGGIQCSISSKLGKQWCKNLVFGRKITVFSKPLAEFWRYQKSETTKRCATQSCIIHLPSSKFSDQYWWIYLRELLGKDRNRTGWFRVFFDPL